MHYDCGRRRKITMGATQWVVGRMRRDNDEVYERRNIGQILKGEEWNDEKGRKKNDSEMYDMNILLIWDLSNETNENRLIRLD